MIISLTWKPDHDIDDPHADMSNQIDVFFGRGMTIRGGGPSWFRGTSSEHSYLYQYNIAEAQNIYMSIIQTESPYYQGAAHTQTPALFNREKFVGDPVWDMCGSATVDCNVAWALLVQFSERIYIDGAGLYSWFKDYKQDCVQNNSCQQRLVNIYNVGKLYLNHLSTIGAVETLTLAISNKNNEIKYAKDHLQATVYPWWATIATYLDSQDVVNQTSPARFPIKDGFVSFGDSYAAGIGAGKPLDKVSDCSRGRGSYMAILNQILRFSHDIPQLDWQPLACSGETAAQFLKGGEKGKQIETWQPASSDLATVSFTGNDLGFGDIVSHCIMGYPYGSRSKCQGDIASAAAKLESGLIGELVAEVMDKIIGKAYVRKKDRFVVYWTGYPKFFTVADTVCDASYFQEGIWAGEYLTTTLRNQLNELSVRVNDDIDFAIRKYNAGLPYPKVVFVSPEKLGLYNNKRFCEPGVKETLKSEADQKKVAFFYDNGYDDIPSESESFFMPPKWKDDAPDDWAIRIVTSRDCSPLKAAASGDASDFDEILCGFAQAIQNGTIKPLDYPGGGGAVTYNRDGSITVADTWVRFNKMFHPKTRANWHIAQAVSDALRRN